MHVERTLELTQFLDRTQDLIEQANTTELDTQERVVAVSAVLRWFIKSHALLLGHDEFLHTIKQRALVFCSGHGIIEAYLTLWLFWPEMCTEEIQPWFPFCSDKSYYSEEHFLELKNDPDFGPLQNQASYLFQDAHEP
jgi:hypothetical protein